MEDNRTDYEPNFVMRDAEEPIFENPSYVSADTFFGDEGPAPTPQPTTPTEEDGLYVDPRDNFRKEAKAGAGVSGAAASARWCGGKARAERGRSGSGFAGSGSGNGSNKGK